MDVAGVVRAVGRARSRFVVALWPHDRVEGGEIVLGGDGGVVQCPGGWDGLRSGCEQCAKIRQDARAAFMLGEHAIAFARHGMMDEAELLLAEAARKQGVGWALWGAPAPWHEALLEVRS